MHNEPVFLVSDFSLRYLLIFQDHILVLNLSCRYQKKNLRCTSEMILRPEHKSECAKTVLCIVNINFFGRFWQKSLMAMFNYVGKVYFQVS